MFLPWQPFCAFSFSPGVSIAFVGFFFCLFSFLLSFWVRCFYWLKHCALQSSLFWVWPITLCTLNINSVENSRVNIVNIIQSCSVYLRRCYTTMLTLFLLVFVEMQLWNLLKLLLMPPIKSMWCVTLSWKEPCQNERRRGSVIIPASPDLHISLFVKQHP